MLVVVEPLYCPVLSLENNSYPTDNSIEQRLSALEAIILPTPASIENRLAALEADNENQIVPRLVDLEVNAAIEHRLLNRETLKADLETYIDNKFSRLLENYPENGGEVLTTDSDTSESETDEEENPYSDALGDDEEELQAFFSTQP